MVKLCDLVYYENNSIFNKATGRAVMPSVSSLAKGVVLMIMSTYEEFMIILTTALLIITVLKNDNHKK
jgi:hypothetical protein